MYRRLAISVAAPRLVSRALLEARDAKFLADRRQGPGQRGVEWVLSATLALKLWIQYGFGETGSTSSSLFFHLSTMAFTTECFSEIQYAVFSS